MAKGTQAMVANHELQDVVTVLHGFVEDIVLPEKVDVIISEWMGFLLFRENMFDSVLVARDRWLKPGGVMYPSRAQLHLASLDNSEFTDQRVREIEAAMSKWDDLSAKLATRYSLRLDGLRTRYLDEHFQYAFHQAWLEYLPASAIKGEPQLLLDLDMHKVTREQVFGAVYKVRLEKASEESPVHGLCGWFDVHFCGHDKAPAQKFIYLDTSPYATQTHWAQTLLLLWTPLTSPDVAVQLMQSSRSHHDLNVTLHYGETTASYLITNEIPTPFFGDFRPAFPPGHATHGE
eukprot:gnl/MRDRNA2_/MRDRNA2_20560_c0_seq1.p1 gnl/MRDRNA2_/MRDRNA2_20560_c0~~gnl/MRDRNA2_/MRDRNA2_20560_c0_seq1.p1  ORF type:complete len:290 (-),score=36.90 gnl/MRDRNA2_/MRDRNA2_20560_c0_seq1:406-1275(-)